MKCVKTEADNRVEHSDIQKRTNLSLRTKNGRLDSDLKLKSNFNKFLLDTTIYIC